MSAQLSRERLEEKLLEHIKHGGDSEEETMIRMLLAGMSSEPLAYFYPGDETEWQGVALAEELDDEQKARCIPLYTAAPAPVAVPDEAVVGEMSFLGSGEASYVRGWNDLRAAILKAGPVTGWIKCSERMPEQKQTNRYIGLNLLLNERTVVQGGFDDGSFWLDGEKIDNVTRWMPLPAAPEQEV